MMSKMKLASIFTDDMVLQAGKPIRIFGEGCGRVTVTPITASNSKKRRIVKMVNSSLRPWTAAI